MKSNEVGKGEVGISIICLAGIIWFSAAVLRFDSLELDIFTGIIIAVGLVLLLLGNKRQTGD